VAVFEGVVGWGDIGRLGETEPGGLEVHDLYEVEIAGVIEDGRAGEGLEAGGAGDVVDVGVTRR